MNKQKYFYLCIIFCLAVSRFIYLDQDVGPRVISGLTAEDEAIYAHSAILYNNESNDKLLSEFNEYKLVPFSLYSFPLTAVSLSINGNSFYGLRIPVVLVSLLSILLLFFTIKKITNSQNLAYFSSIFLLIEFYFYSISRIQNPHVYSILILSILIYFITNNYSIKNFFFIGFILVISITFFYIYNLFLCFAIFVWLIYILLITKNWKFLISCFLGFVLGLLIFIICLWLTSSINDYYNMLINHNGGKTLSITLLSFINAFTQITNTNFFRYNLFLLFLFITSFILIIKNFKCLPQKIKSIVVFLISAFIGVYLQNIFVINFAFKKLVILLPLTIITICICINYINLKEINIKIKSCIILFSFLFLFYNLKLNLSNIYWNNLHNLQNVSKLFTILNCIVLFIVVIGFYFNKLNSYIVIIVIFIPSLFLNFKYYYIERKYNLRNALIDIGSKYKNYVILEDHGHYHQFYSNNIPGLNYYYQNILSTHEYKTISNKICNNYDKILMIKIFDLNEISEYNDDSKKLKVNNFDFLFKQKYKLEYYELRVFEKSLK